MSDLRQRVPGHSLIDELLRQWDLGNIHLGTAPGEVVIDDEAVSWYRGVLGERHVADVLARLGAEWTVLHSVPAGSGGRDIDHVVIGPSGVFTINTKYSPGRDIWSAGFGLMVDGHRQHGYIQAAMTELRQAEAALSRVSGSTVPVTGLIVFVDPGRVTRKAPAGDGTLDLQVVSDRELFAALTGRRVFSDEQVARIAAAACDPSTWLRRPEPSTIGDHIAREFAALEEAVGPAMAQPSLRVARSTGAVRSNRASRSRTTPARPPGRSASRPSRKKPTLADRIFTRLVVPVGAFVFLWVYLTQIAGR